MLTLSFILRRISYNFGELISCFRVHIPPVFVESPSSNGGDLLLAGITVVVYRDSGESFLSGEYF